MKEFFRGTVTPKDWAISGGIGGAAVVVCAAFYVLIYGPQNAAVEEAGTVDRQVQEDLKKARETEKNIDGLRAEAGKMQELVTQFEKRLPETSEIPTLLKQFEGFAHDVGLKVELSTLPSIPDVRKETIPYRVVARGNFHQIVSFINRLERFQRYLKVSDLKIDAEKEGIAEATFTLGTFRFVQSTEAASPGSKPAASGQGAKS